MRLLRTTVLMFLYVGGLILMTYAMLAAASSGFEAGRGRETVRNDQVPPEFPVLIVWQKDGIHHGEIVPYSRLGEETENRERSFLVPPSEVGALRREVASKGSFEVRTLPHGRQTLRVMYTWHGGLNHESGWYIADRNGITPTHYKGYMEGRLLFNDLPVLLAVYTILWVVGLILYRRHARRKHVSI